jgi:LysM repeat protein
LYEVNIGDSEMATVMSSEREPADLETLPEYVRESKMRSRDSLEFVSTKPPSTTESAPLAPNDSEGPQTDILEALWPGVHQDFTNPVRRAPSFYLSIGFVAGAAVTLVGVWLFSLVPSMVSGFGKPNSNTIVTQSTNKTTGAGQSGPVSEEAVEPSQSTYEVQSGDTLAAIAFRNYKRVSPRLLDEICAANNMKNANVLSLGQKLMLPIYRPQAKQPDAPTETTNPAASTL